MSETKAELGRAAREVTQSLAVAGAELAGRGETDEARRQREGRLRLLIDNISLAVLSCDGAGRIEYFNASAATLWGRLPEPRDEWDRFSGKFRLFRAGGDPMPVTEGPMAECLRTGVAQLDREFVIERPDGSRVTVLVNVTPTKDDLGRVTGAVSCMLDISERKRTDALLRAREREFRTIVENTPDLILRYDRQLRRTFVNRAVCVLYGLPESALLGEIAGTGANDNLLRVPLAMIEQVRCGIQKVFDTGKPEDVPFRMLGTEGRRTYMFHLLPEYESGGSITSVLALGRDVTDYESAEVALRRAQDYLAEGQRLTHTGSWAWSAKTRENLFWSEETYRIFGLEPTPSNGSLLSKAPYRETLERVHPEDRREFEARVERAIRSGKDFERSYRVALPDGTIKYIHSCGHLVRDEKGEVVEVVGTAMDVTERKLADSLLAAEKHTLEMIASGAPLAAVLNVLCSAVDDQAPGLISTILILDPDGRKLWPMAGPHTPPGWNEVITPLPIGPHVGSCGTAAFRRQRVVVTDIMADPLWLGYQEAARAHGLRSCWSTPIFSVTGKVLGTFAMYYGQPREPQARDFQLIDRATHLAQIAIERDRTQESLREAQMDLARVSRITTIGELTAAITHEVNQPLAAIETYASACVRWLGSTPPNLGEARKTAGWIAREAQRTGEIIARVRALLTKGEPAKAPFEVNDVVREVVAFTQSEAIRQNVMVELALVESSSGVYGDRVQIQQVVLNLVMNGIESLAASKDRTRVLRIATDRSEPGSLRVSVRDTGIGLSPEQMDRLFEAFYTTKKNGLGMGLSISRSIVEAHGGRLWATPNQGPGVTFQFTLPLDGASNR